MKSIRYYSVIFLICLFLAGCGAAGKANDSSSADIPAEQSSASSTEDTPSDNNSAEEKEQADRESGPEEESLPEQEPEPFIENISNNEEGHFTFNPHVFGSRYLEQFGESMRDTFFAYCDALRSGEDSFACPDETFAGWCSGRFSNFFFPVACQKIETGVWADGRAKIIYRIPKEEFLKQEKEFEAAITGILNDSISDDYSDLEKILALYEYMTTNYTYDYEMYEHTVDWMDKQSPYRCLMEGQGICCEIAGLYNYLLLQVGIDSEEMGGTVHYSEDFAEGHSWVFVNLNGKCYHIDPTYGLTEGRPPLCYFMMTDELREERDMFPIKEFTIAAGGDESRKLFEYEAVNSDYSELWSGFYVGMDRAAHEILYTVGDEMVEKFSYAE